MKKRSLTLLLGILMCLQSYEQNTVDSSTQIQISKFYSLGLQYKDGIGVKMDYARAYDYFSLAAGLNDPQSIYAQAYMNYKGLGCSQNYSKAVILFNRGALQGRDNSMYFLGLCYKNGYGIARDTAKANFWLRKADSLGYAQATKELKLSKGENSNDSAKSLVTQIQNASMPNASTLNQYSVVNSSLPVPAMLKGDFSGYLVQYDWSGNNVVEVKNLQLLLEKSSEGTIEGKWIEGRDTAIVKGSINSNQLEFKKSSYKRIDYYNYDSSGIVYNFKDASLNMVQTTDSIYISGNINMFSPQRKEPSKPMMVVLAKLIPPDSIPLMTITVGPNPFSSQLNVNFQLGKSANVETQLMDMAGKIIYDNRAGNLEAGTYSLPVYPRTMSTGMYFLKVIYGSQSKVIKVVKE